MKRIVVSFVVWSMVLGLGLVVLAGCVTPTVTGAALPTSGVPLKADSMAKPSDDLSVAINDFGLDLAKASSTDPSKNAVVSPASVHAALSMTANGANGETAEQMRHVLHVDAMTTAESNKGWASLIGGLGDRSPEQTLEIANSLWARKGIAFKKPFIAADRDYFGAQVSTLDFTQDDVPGAINGWVSDNTHGMITKMIDQVPANAILYLANAVYFKGEWVSPFTHESTSKQSFNKQDGSTVDVDMMHESGPMPYGENDTVQATKLPYRGGDTAFYVLLPKPGVKTDVALDGLKGADFRDLRRAMASNEPTRVYLGLPKLEVEFSADLSKQLADLGMPRAFDDRRAQFSSMAELDVPIYINRVLHKTKVKVDEKGTEAAAATVVGMALGSATPERAEPKWIICDRPYVFAIVDEASGAMLFLGVVNDPRK
ncbi:MAG: serpin family protein [Actinobacteria bacterium]|nr:serpin family protein [Actinomycetota bacterium]MCG2807022.1 serpin family protein [Coriobacteriia bacterium]